VIIKAWKGFVMDVGFLEPLYEQPGPCACVYLGTECADAAEHMIELRWQQLRGRLEERGTDFRTLGAIDTIVGSDRGLPSPRGQAIFAARGEVLLQEELRSPSVPDRATLAQVPDVMPLLAQHPDIPAHVLVLADRTAAAVEVHTTAGISAREEVQGADHPAANFEAGDWNQPCYQPRAENTWDANARSTAKTVERIAAAHHAAMIAVAGDVRARTLLLEHLDPVWRYRAVAVDGEPRSGGADLERVRGEAMTAAAEFEQTARAQVRERFAHGLAAGGAVEGLEPTVDALRSGTVDTLLLRYGSAEAEAPAWWGPEPGQLAVHPEELAEVRSQQTRRDRAADVLVRALVWMRGRLLVVSKDEPGPESCVGALLRFS
jgi:hypothetical protein